MSTTRADEPTKTQAIEQERARLRRNQRNSRARKQAYVQDLEARWADCVSEGAQASSELQWEARRVLSENKALRNMLHELGVDDAAIQRRIASSTIASSLPVALEQTTCAQANTACPRPNAAAQLRTQIDRAPIKPSEADFTADQAVPTPLRANSSDDNMLEWDLEEWLQDLTHAAPQEPGHADTNLASA